MLRVPAATVSLLLFVTAAFADTNRYFACHFTHTHITSVVAEDNYDGSCEAARVVILCNQKFSLQDLTKGSDLYVENGDWVPDKNDASFLSRFSLVISRVDGNARVKYEIRKKDENSPSSVEVSTGACKLKTETLRY